MSAQGALFFYPVNLEAVGEGLKGQDRAPSQLTPQTSSWASRCPEEGTGPSLGQLLCVLVQECDFCLLVSSSSFTHTKMLHA